MTTGTDAFAERIFGSALGYFDILSTYLGLRLGLYDALRGADGLTAAELALGAGIDERYAREWLEQQATTGTIDADVTADPPRFRLPAAHAEVLLDVDSLAFMGSSVRQLASLRGVIDHVAEAFRNGDGISYDVYGHENVEGQGGANRPVFLTTLPNEWLPAISAFHDRLSAGPTRVLDIGCGAGWSAIATARAYPHAEVEGIDPDPTSISNARRNADDAGVTDRVRFREADASTIEGSADLAMAFECVHDMSDPVGVLSAVRSALSDDGAMLIVDERTRDAFDGTPDELEAYFYGWSVFDCLPTGMAASPSAGTGAVMRATTLEGYAKDAGFTRFEVLPIEHDAFRLYLLRP